MELTERQERILKAVVEDYVNGGRPSGSGALVERSGLGVSSATIRHELAWLEELGLVIQLHTSGGRIPTTSGYRYYIEHMLATPDMSDEDQVTIRHQFHQVHTELDEWLKLAAAVVAHRAHNVALITSPRTEEACFKHLELIESQPHTILIILVLSDGAVLQEMMSIEEPMTHEALRSNADQLNAAFASKRSVPGQKDIRFGLPANVRPFAEVVLAMLTRARERRMQVYHQGLGEMLSRPEFSPGAHPNLAEGDRLRRVVDFLQQGLAMEDLLTLMAMESGVQVVIGGEAPLRHLQDYSIVVGRYGDTVDGSGVVGVLGPTRMDYGRAISLVRYMTELMTDLIVGR